LRIVDEMGQDLPRGRKGEVLAQGPQVFTGYHNAPELTQAAFVDGWYRTGDVGYLDENGFLFLVDRLKDIIKTAGYTVYPAEVEATLAEHPAVAMSAVVGLAHEGVGEVVQAFVVLKPGGIATARELIAHCKARLASHKCPRRIEFRDGLPLTPTGKVLKRALG
jgi:long-chain acyl-CoA synthetase